MSATIIISIIISMTSIHLFIYFSNVFNFCGEWQWMNWFHFSQKYEAVFFVLF